MRNRFFNTVFTPGVLAEQARHGSQRAYAKFTDSADPTEAAAVLGLQETSFVATRDSFYLATTSVTGWPQVQHRGGPRGFVRMLDDRTLAWADFIGNRQYVSIGNAATNAKVAMIFMDYPHRARLKVLGHMHSFEADERPDLLSALVSPEYPGRVEHLIAVAVEAYDWNCPQHITPRFTAQEIADGLAAEIQGPGG